MDANKLIELSQDFICTTDLKGIITFSNPACFELLGYQPDEIIDRNFSDFIHQDDIDKTVKEHKNILSRQKVIYFENRYIHKNGSVKCFSWKSMVDLTEDCVYSIGRDITDQRAVQEEALILKKAMNSATEAISLCDADGKHFYLNKAFTSLFGYQLNDFHNTSCKTLFEDKKIANKVFETIQSQKSWSGELHMKNKNNKVLTINLSADAIKDETGKVIGLIGMHRDVSERVEIEHNKDVQHLKTLTLLDAIDEIIYLADPETYELVYTNKKFNTILGIGQIPVGKKCHEIIQGKAEPCEFCTNHTIFKEKPNENHIWEFQNLTNSKWYRCTDKAINWVDGRKLRMEMAIDITNEKENRIALEKSEERYNLAIAASDNGIWDWDIPTNELFYCKQWKAQLGYQPNELINEFATWEKLLHPDCKERMIQSVQNFLASPKEFFLEEFRMMHKDGTPRWILNRAAAVKNKQGQVIRMLGAHKDITQQKKAQEELRKYDKMFRGIIENAPDGVVMISFESKFKFASNSTLKMFGYSAEELLAMHPNDLTHPDDLPFVLKNLKETITTDKTPSIEYRFKTANNNWLWIESTFSKSYDEEGNPTIVINFRDIQERKEYEQKLLEAKTEAESANKQKNYFLANMSHEIRTPLSGILGFANILIEEDVPEKEQKHYMQIIDSNSRQVLNLIDDIMDVAKIEAGEIRIKKAECHLQHMLDELETNFNQLKIKHNKEHISFKLDMPQKYKDLILLTDNFRLHQVLSNLLNNALKFTEKGTITFGYEVKETEIQFFVKDTGIGIKQAHLTQVFERFKQVNYKDNAKYGGTGLGLTICKNIIELLGGKITVSSKFSIGTTFTFTLPLKLSSNKDINQTLIKRKDNLLLNKTILIVEDEPGLQVYLKRIFRNSGAILLFAKNGKIGVELYKANTAIECVLMDIRMPVMDGFEALSEILKIDAQAIVIMQTAFINPEEKEKSFNLGCKDYMVKPIEKDKLYNVLAKWL